VKFEHAHDSIRYLGHKQGRIVLPNFTGHHSGHDPRRAVHLAPEDRAELIHETLDQNLANSGGI